MRAVRPLHGVEALERLRRHATALILALLVLLPVCVKLPVLSGMLVADTATRYAGLEVERSSGLTAGGSTVDPNIGYTSHALGTYAARELMAGRLPWWNPYEGVGVPLAAGMQSAALFPLTPLLLLPHGQIIFHLVLQIIGGLTTFALLRTLGLTRMAAGAGALLFEFNAVFAWFANAVVNPVAFLPMLLWGVELQFASSPHRRAVGVAIGAFALAASLYAGFPEVAFLNGLLVALWTLVRGVTIAPDLRWPALASVMLSAVAGVLLAAPIVVPFLSYLPTAELGMHGGAPVEFRHLDARYFLLALAPYYLGGIFSRPIIEAFWGEVGGYAGLILPAMALAGLGGTRWRALRWALAGWVAVSLVLTYSDSLFFVVKWLPGLREAALYRYLPTSWILALVVLAAMSLDDVINGRNRQRAAIAAAALSMVAIVALLGGHDATGWLPRNLYAWAATLPQLALFAAFAAVLACRPLADRRRGMLLAALACVEALWLFALPVLAHPRRMVVVENGVRFLQAQLGLQRFATLGPIAPNYGTYYGIAQVNHNDLPVPIDWVRYVRRHLDPAAHPILFTRVSDPAVLASRRTAYAAIGVRYVVAAADTPLPGFALVHRDARAAVYSLPEAKPYFSAPDCRIAARTRDLAVAQCRRPSVLTRLELFTPEWQAWVDNRFVTVRRTGEIFQAVALPVGRAEIRFVYTPPHATLSAAAALAGLLLVVGLCAALLHNRGMMRSRRT